MSYLSQLLLSYYIIIQSDMSYLGLSVTDTGYQNKWRRMIMFNTILSFGLMLTQYFSCTILGKFMQC